MEDNSQGENYENSVQHIYFEELETLDRNYVFIIWGANV